MALLGCAKAATMLGSEAKGAKIEVKLLGHTVAGYSRRRLGIERSRAAIRAHSLLGSA